MWWQCVADGTEVDLQGCTAEDAGGILDNGGCDHNASVLNPTALMMMMMIESESYDDDAIGCLRCAAAKYGVCAVVGYCGGTSVDVCVATCV